jgi:hypothetical protein
MIKKYTEKSHKVSASYAYDYLSKANNNGWKAEALALLILHCTEHNPYLDAEKGGDVYSPKYGNVQVKFMNGRIPGKIGNDLNESLREAFEADASETWMIFFSLEEYILIDKWELYKIMTNKFNRDQFFKNDTGLRIQIGVQKKKYFKSEMIQKTPERLLKLL